MNLISNYWICAFEYNQYIEYIDYIINNKTKKIYLPSLMPFNGKQGDIVFLYHKFCKIGKIKGGIFGYAILDKINEPTTINIFKDALNNRYCFKIKKIVINNNPVIDLADILLSNKEFTVKTFLAKYIKKFLLVENMKFNIGEYFEKKIIIKKLSDAKDAKDTKDVASQKKVSDNSSIGSSLSYESYKMSPPKKKPSDISSNSSNNSNLSYESYKMPPPKKKPSNKVSENSSNHTSHSNLSYESYKMAPPKNKSKSKDGNSNGDSDSNSNSDSDSDDNSNSNSNSNNSISSNESDNSDDSEDKPDPDIDNKNSLIPIFVELCKDFKFINTPYDTKKYNKQKNPDIDAKCAYFKEHIRKCIKCDITNNNCGELSSILEDAVMTFQKYTDINNNNGDLEEGIDKYHNARKYDGFGYDLDKKHIKLNYISDADNIYDNCILIYCTLKAI